MSKCEIKEINVQGRSPLKLGGSSKGASDKFFEEGIWYKQDSIGYESLAEILASRAIKLTNYNLPYVSYGAARIYSGSKFLGSGCFSESFLGRADTETTLKRLLEKQYGNSKVTLKEIIYCLSTLEEGNKLIDQLSFLFQWDRICLNTDRHLNNIILRIQAFGTMDLICFDMGDSLGADITFEFPETISAHECIECASAKPLFCSFDAQCEAIRSYSNFSLKATSSTLQVSDLRGLVPDTIFERMLSILSINFSKYLNTDLVFI